MSVWNPWHGCRKISPGCVNCYVYRRDESIGKDASAVTKTGDFDLPLKKDRKGKYKLTPEDGTVFTCMTSDFFLDEADAWRPACWDMIRARTDLHFFIITKRIGRFRECAPPDWGDGWDNVTDLPLKHREVICEPMLGPVEMEKYLATGLIEHVTCGGESGPKARPCEDKWIREVRRECIRQGVPFTFKQTGAVFVMDGRTYRIERKDQIPQARKSGWSYVPGENSGAAVVYRLPQREALREALGRSAFRSRFHLSEEDRKYVAEKGLETVRRHAAEIVAKRLAPENPDNDGKQTPMKGHPVFIAQHATACCCRACLEKWHHIPAGKVLTEEEQAYVTAVITDWIEGETAPAP